MAAELSRQTGRQIGYRNLAEAEYAAVLAGAGVPEALARMVASWDTATSHGALHESGGELSKLIGRPTTRMAASVAVQASRR
jgi:NAD(P)H dehydrogenase (quinone)